MCCHPALSLSSAIALTLRAIGGLTTAEIANAFLVPEATMAQRISRAKQTIKASGVPFRLPSPHERTERLPAVLHVLYLIFSEGYASSIGSHLQRLDLAREAIRLTRKAKPLLADNPEVAGLLALMLLTHARRAARTGPDEELIPLDKQDRSVWDRAQISEGIEFLTAALSNAAVGLYQFQATVAAVHDEAERVEDTDRPHGRGEWRIHRPSSAMPRRNSRRLLPFSHRRSKMRTEWKAHACGDSWFTSAGDPEKNWTAATPGADNLSKVIYVVLFCSSPVLSPWVLCCCRMEVWMCTGMTGTNERTSKRDR